MEYLIAKWLHILSSTLLFGTGIGTAFFLLKVTLSRDVRAIAVVTRQAVIADWLFTAPTALFQPLSGFWLLHLMNVPPATPWVHWSILLYAAAIACWLPVVWIQMKLRDIAREAALHPDAGLPFRYWQYFRLWVALGVPAFCAFVAIFYLMVFKPS
jgi:uncharacterized membrane protein